MDDEFLANVAKEGEDPFAALETDTPSDSPAEKEPEAPVEEQLPFHEHPRWKQRDEELKTLRERTEVYERELAEIKAFKEEQQRNQPTNIPGWFKELYGENEVAYRKYEEHEQKKELEIERRVIEKQQEAARKDQEQLTHWNKWVSDQIDQLRSEGKEFDENDLKKTMLDYRPTDDNNNLDFKKGYEIYKAMHKPDPARSQARKQIADTVTHASPIGEKPVKDYMTANELRNRSWSSL